MPTKKKKSKKKCDIGPVLPGVKGLIQTAACVRGHEVGRVEEVMREQVPDGILGVLSAKDFIAAAKRAIKTIRSRTGGYKHEYRAPRRRR